MGYFVRNHLKISSLWQKVNGLWADDKISAGWISSAYDWLGIIVASPN